MKTKKSLFSAVLVLALTVLACRLPTLQPTSEPPTHTEELPITEIPPAGGIVNAIPLPGDLDVITAPALLSIDFHG